MVREMAYHDALTHLPNRSLFNDRLNLEMTRARRHQQRLAMLLLDLDHFKQVNDTLGHGMGDQLLQAVGERLTGLVRKNDTVARMGGDEFVLMLPEITKPEDVAMVAEKIVEGFRTLFVLDGHELLVTTSIGIALYPDDGEEGDALMKSADIAMYRAKQQGRNNYQIHDHHLHGGGANRNWRKTRQGKVAHRPKPTEDQTLIIEGQTGVDSH